MNARNLILAFLAITGFFCLGNWALPLIDRDEPRFAEASREMLQRGDYVVPYFNGITRFDKPPLIYWMQCASYRAFGVNEFAARFPAALMAAATCILIALWGRRIWNAQIGCMAALMFALCLQLFVHGRSAVADMPMVFFVAVAAWAGWELVLSPAPSRHAGIWFWVALAMGFLAKGPIAWVPIGMVGWTLRTQAARRPKWHWALLGALLMLALIGAWGIPALIQTHGEFAEVGLGKHVVGRSLGTMEGHGSKGLGGWLLSLPMYFVTIFASFFPWAFWLPKAIASVRKGGLREDATCRYLMVGVVLVFGIFTLSRTKLPHYTLPCFPFLALIMARWWSEHRSMLSFRRWAIGMAVGGLVLSMILFPLGARAFVTPQILRATAPILTPDMALGAIEYQEPSLVWSLRRTLDGYLEPLKPKDAKQWLSSPGRRMLVLPTDMLKDSQVENIPGIQRFDVSGVNFVKGRKMGVTALVKTSRE